MTKELSESAKKFVKMFEDTFDDLTVKLLIDYDNKYFVVMAVPDVNEPVYDDPYFAIEKGTGKVVNFSPAYDLEKFKEAVNNRTIYSYGD